MNVAVESQPSRLTSAPEVKDDLRVVNHSQWRRAYARMLAWVDLGVIVWAIAGAYLLRYGFTAEPLVFMGDERISNFTVTYATLSIVLVVVWWLALVLGDTRQFRILGEGAEEYKRIARSSFFVFGGLAIIAFIFRIDVARGFLAVAFPAGLVGLLVARAFCRELLRTRRRAGHSCDRVIVAGNPLHVGHVIEELASKPESGYKVVGAVLDDASDRGLSTIEGAPVLGDTSSVIDVLNKAAASAVIMASSSALRPDQMQRIGWQLENTDIELIMSPSLTNIAGPRIHMRPVSGLPLLHVEGPRLPRSGRILKTAFDRVAALGIIIVLSPVIIGFALAVKFTSKGPIIYKQERIGENGKPFSVYKFRSMVVDADAQLQKLLAEQGQSGGPLAKPENDPRITPIGHFIRKYSIDELPQLFNVLFGSMSLVGPRPQRSFEVELYSDGAERRLLCKPGMTGLWQVSGRSDMAWEKAVRLDLYYVENWSFTFDLLLLWRTVGVVLQGAGAR